MRASAENPKASTPVGSSLADIMVPALREMAGLFGPAPPWLKEGDWRYAFSAHFDFVVHEKLDSEHPTHPLFAVEFDGASTYVSTESRRRDLAKNRTDPTGGQMAGTRYPQGVLVCPHERANEANPARPWRRELELCPADRGFEADGYLVHAFGKKCVDDDDSPRPDPSAVLERRLGYEVFRWPLEPSRAGWEQDDFCDLVEVFHDLVARPSRRSYHSYASCGWHYWDFATGPARKLYRWRVNQLLASSTLGLRLAEEGEDLGRLVRVEPTGLEDLPERALRAATPDTVDRVQHAIALFRSRTASVEERRSAVITLAGILEERRSLLKAELLTKDEEALFTIANQFAVRHQRADQRGDYDSAFLDWLFW